jgi:hypothetical protein
MGLSAAARSAAQSFDRTAADYDRMGDLAEDGSIGSWLASRSRCTPRRGCH